MAGTIKYQAPFRSLMQTRSGRFARVVGIVFALALAVGAPFALAEVTGRHTVEKFLHGIEGVGPFAAVIEYRETDPRYTLLCAELQAGMYHHNPNGTWNNQTYQYDECGWWVTVVYAPAGSIPCAKYAWTYGSAGPRYLAWHGMRANQCNGRSEY